MSRRIFPTALALVLALPLRAAAAQQPPSAAPTDSMRTDSMVVVHADSVKWDPTDIPGFAPGMQIAVLAGDPTKAGPFALRLRFPDGYTIPAHWHPQVENLTVVSGRYFVGMGEKADSTAMRAYAPGDFLSIPARMPHYGRVTGETVIQLHGTGPFTIELARPAGR